jgi:16S rRNA (cytidine1402-2'-O)-methyltransferase
VAELAIRFEETPARGEVVILIGGATEEKLDEDALKSVAREMLSEGKSARDTVDHLISRYGAPRNLAYKLAHEE